MKANRFGWFLLFLLVSAGVAKDDAEAVKWYRKAAEQNTPRLNSIWAVCYAMAEAWRRMRWRR
jgi:TPR repeat protein